MLALWLYGLCSCNQALFFGRVVFVIISWLLLPQLLCCLTVADAIAAVAFVAFVAVAAVDAVAAAD